MQQSTIPRRQFLISAGAAAAALSVRSLTFAAAPTTATSAAPVIRAGMITDLHHMMFKRDQVFRLKAFMDAAVAAKPDFILQCGDLCYPKGCPEILAEWNRFAGPKYHVLGNHDMDLCDKKTIMDLWGMTAPYYSFDVGGDQGGFHFIVLDRNFFITADKKITDYAKGNWYNATTPNISCINDEQLTWLKQDLARTDRPTVVFVHQPLIATDEPQNIGNCQPVIEAFELANLQAMQSTGRPRVVAVFGGHDHNDLYAEQNGVHYVLLNSASYAYTGASGACYYQDPLFAFVTFDPAGRITIEGRSSSYGPKGAPEKVRMKVQPKISSRTFATVL